MRKRRHPPDWSGYQATKTKGDPKTRKGPGRLTGVQGHRGPARSRGLVTKPSSSKVGHPTSYEIMPFHHPHQLKRLERLARQRPSLRDARRGNVLVVMPSDVPHPVIWIAHQCLNVASESSVLRCVRGSCDDCWRGKRHAALIKQKSNKRRKGPRNKCT